MFDNENAAVYQEEEASITSPSPKPISTKPAKRKKTMKKSSVKKAIKKTVKKATKTGTRYTEAEKQKVIDFVKNNPGRGSLSKAVREFGVTFLTLKSWLKKEGGQVEKAVKSIVKSVKGKRGRPKGSVSKALGKGVDEFDSLVKAIQAKRSELKDLMTRLQKVI